jgi:hypothetical protein
MEPPDVIRRPCMGLPPGTPCPTHALGTWPKHCICYQEGNYPMRRDRLTWITIGILIALTTGIGVWLAIEFAFGADVDPVCMTKTQAAARYPKQWLYWHGANHCWDNHSGRLAVRHPATPQPAPEPHAPSIDMPEGPSIAYPSLMGGGGTDDAMLRPQPMTVWPEIFDFDVEPPPFIPWRQRISFTVAAENEGKP